MDYEKHYNLLINRARGRQLSGYSERHHIVPRCMGGDNSKTNIVRLTPEEHYIAHLLLVKMHPGHEGLLWAAMAMTNGTDRHQRSNKAYGWLRRQFSEEVRKRKTGSAHSAETRLKLSISRRNRTCSPHSLETKVKMSIASKGRPKSIEHRLALSKAKLGTKAKKPRSDESRDRSSVAIRAAFAKNGVDRSFMLDPDYKEKQRLRTTELWAKRRRGELPMPKPPALVGV